MAGVKVDSVKVDGVKAARLSEAETEKEFATQSPQIWSKPCGFSSSAAQDKVATKHLAPSHSFMSADEGNQLLPLGTLVIQKAGVSGVSAQSHGVAGVILHDESSDFPVWLRKVTQKIS